MVTDKARINSRGVVGVPYKHIDVSSKKPDQFLFLFGRQFRADLKELLRVIVNGDLI